MLQLRKSDERGTAFYGWLKSRHTFSFADYHDPKFMGFRSLRVINEDRIEGGSGFGAHPHRDMEIISYVVSGALEHKDSMGTIATIRPGEVQRMSAGRGVVHSEYNQQKDQETHFLQIWIVPNHKGGSPGYGQKSFADELKSGKLVLVVSHEGREGSIRIEQDADIYLARMKKNETLDFQIRPKRGVWVQMIKGQASINSRPLNAGDGLAVEDEGLLKITTGDEAELMLFDLA